MTVFQVFKGKDAIFETKEPPGLALITNANGTANTFLIVEAGEAVPWTKPEDLVHVADKPLPKLGGIFENGFVAVFVDGHVQFIPKGTEEKAIRKMITWK